jgi:glutamyl-tRNA reductase
VNWHGSNKPLLALGINHKTAPLALREQVVFAMDGLRSALTELLSRQVVSEVAILSTCHRTEVYCHALETPPQLLNWFCGYHRLPVATVAPHTYLYKDRAAVAHMMRVASGLDSAIIGEPQILGQMKQAFAIAQSAGALGTQLNRLFQQTFAVAKQVRTDTDIGKQAVSLAFLAMTLAKRIFAQLSTATALVIGAGEMTALAVQHLKANGIANILVANRTFSKATELAAMCGGQALTLEHLPNYLAQADIVISATASPLPILGKGCVETAIRQRKHKPILMIDLAVPRDIEPQVAELPDVYLYTVDDLNQIIQENQLSRANAVQAAEALIDNGATEFMAWLAAKQYVASSVTALRTKVESVREQELAKAKLWLQNGVAPEEALERLAHNLSNKWLHAPTVALRNAAYEGDAALLEAASEILGL